MADARSESDLPIKPMYAATDLAAFDAATQLGDAGKYPFTRGVYPSMYTGRPWTMRQYAGFGTAKESNERYHQLVAAGTGGLSVAFDLPTQMGYDSDESISSGEVGKVGVAIDSIDDMRVLFDGLPLDKISTSMTINAPGSTLLLLYQLVAEEQGISGDQLTGTIQNDVLKEYIARGTYIYPPKESLRLIADIFAYCQAEMPRWNTISISGYHMAEAGATPAQEIAFTLGPTPRSMSGPPRRPAWTSMTSRPDCPSSSWLARRCWRRSRSSVPPGGSGPRSCATSSAPRTPRARCCASTPRRLVCS
jgi:methylmalonyl-CoA mutase N-terminal domain/subunit